MQIDVMRTEDLPAVTRLAAQLGYPNELESVRERFDGFSHDPDYALFVAREGDGRVVGWIQVNREPLTLLAGPKAEIAALVVDESLRGHGIGKVLVRQAEIWARDQGLPLMRLRSNLKREEAHRFYLREGYAIAKSAHMFVKPL